MNLAIPPGEFSAYIFDLDGTLLDTMPLHYRAWDAVLRDAGMSQGLDEALFYSLSGAAPHEFTDALAAHYGLQFDAQSLLRAKEKFFNSVQHEVALIKPTVEFARLMASTRPLAIASGGSRNTVLTLLEWSGLKPLFPTIVTGDDVRYGKPAPDLFLLAAQQMKVEATACLVFEDSDPGIQAAEAAGMRWVRVAK